MNSRDLMRSINEIDDELLIRSERSARPRRRVLYRIAAAAAALLFVFGAAFGIAKAIAAGKTGTSEPPKYAFLADTSVPADAVLPPSQMGGAGTMNPSHDKLRDLKEIYEESDAVCIITIGDWLGESEVSTYYEATVEHVYKGDPGESFVLHQTGNSKALYSDTPLFSYGDKLLVGVRFLNNRRFENTYYCIGGETTTAYVSLAEDGSAYVIDPKGIFSHYTEFNHPELHFTEYGENEALAKELFDELGKYDRVMADHLSEWFGEYYADRSGFVSDGSMIPHIYSLEEIEAYFAGLE